MPVRGIDKYHLNADLDAGGHSINNLLGIDSKNIRLRDLPSMIDLDGAFAWHQRPQAIYYNKKLYWTWVSRKGDIGISSYDFNTNTFQKTIIERDFETDDHDTPVILIRNSDKRIIVFYCKHLKELKMYWKISSDPENIESFGDTHSFDASGDVTYPQPIQLSGEDDAIYLFYRIDGTPRYWVYKKSTDGGTSFGAEVKMIQAFDHLSPYTHPVSNGVDTIHFSVNDAEGGNGPSEDIMHFYYKGGSFYKSDGTLICDVAGLPITSKSQLTMVYDSSAAGNYECKNWDIALNSSGNPVIVFAEFVDLDTDHRYKRAEWNGSSWDIEEVGNAGPWPYIGPDTHKPYSGGIQLDHSNTDIVYYSKNTDGTPHRWDIYRAEKVNGSWVATKLASDGKNIRPVAVRGSGNNYSHILWEQGVYRGMTDYHTNIFAEGYFYKHTFSLIGNINFLGYRRSNLRTYKDPETYVNNVIQKTDTNYLLYLLGQSDMGWTDLDINTAGSGLVPEKANAVFLFTRFSDTGFPNVDAYLQIRKRGETASSQVFIIRPTAHGDLSGTCLLIGLDSEGYLQYRINASGSNTAGVRLQLQGWIEPA